MFGFKKFSQAFNRVLNELDPLNNDLYRDGVNGRWQQVTVSGQVMDPEQSMRESTVFACIRIISDTLAMLPLVLFRIDQDGNKHPDTADRLFNVLRYAPNARQTAFIYKRFMISSLCLHGYTLGKVIRESGLRNQVIGIEPCHPDYTKFGIRDNGKLYWETVLCKDVLAGKSGRRFVLESDDAYYCEYATLDGVLPISPISYNAETIGFAREMREHGAGMFRNNATPSGILSTEKKLGPEARKRLKGSWQEMQGGGNRGKVAVLEDGFKWQTISMSHQDAQYLETRQYTKEEICGIFGVPTHLISDTKRAKGWSTTEQQMFEYLTFAGNPFIERIEQSITMFLIPQVRWGKQAAIFKTDEILRADAKSRAERNVKYIQEGVLSPNEARRDEGLNKREDAGGDQYRSGINDTGNGNESDPDTDDQNVNNEEEE